MNKKQNSKSNKILTLSNINFIDFQDITERHKDGPIPLQEENVISTKSEYFIIKGRDNDGGLYRIFSTRITNEQDFGYTIIVASETMYERQSDYIKSRFKKLNGIYYTVYNEDFYVINHRVKLKEVDKNGTFYVEIRPENP